MGKMFDDQWLHTLRGDDQWLHTLRDDNDRCCWRVLKSAGGYDGRDTTIFVFWDIENAKVPREIRPENIAANIRRVLRLPSIGWTGQLELLGFCDFNTTSRSFQNKLARGCSWAEFIHTPPDAPDSGDIKLISRLSTAAARWKSPKHVLLITGDSDFCNVVSFLRHQNHIVLAACPLTSALSIKWTVNGALSWSQLASGELGVYVQPRRWPRRILPTVGNIMDTKTTYVWWDLDSCYVPNDFCNDKGMAHLSERICDVLRARNWYGNILFYTYSSTDNLQATMARWFQDNHMGIHGIPQASKYSFSKIAAVDIPKSLAHCRPHSRFVLISKEGCKAALFPVREDNHTVVVVQPGSKRYRHQYPYDYVQWSWPELLYGNPILYKSV